MTSYNGTTYTVQTRLCWPACQFPGLSNLYQGLADAYRSAHLEAEGEGEDAAILPSGLVGARAISASPPPSASSGSSIFSPGRSPEHRYALYMPHGSSTASSSSSTSENVLTPTEERNLNLDSDWQGYSSSIVESYDGPPAGYSFPANKMPSSGCASSPPTSPSALLQRRLAGKANFNLAGLGVQDMREMVIPEAAVKRLGQQRGSTSSMSLKGREGWSETEPEENDTETDREESICETDSIYGQQRENDC